MPLQYHYVFNFMFIPCGLFHVQESFVSIKDINDQVTHAKWKCIVKTVSKWMSLYKWPLHDLFWPFFGYINVNLSQNWGSDGHFEVLNRSSLWLVEKLWHKMQIFPFLFFCNSVQKQIFASFLSFIFFCLLS